MSNGSVFDESVFNMVQAVQPPVTNTEAVKFCRLNIKRCMINIADAKARGDAKAVYYLERKLAAYQYLLNSVKKPNPIPKPKVTECPGCKVVAVEHGICRCCGRVFEED